MIESEFGTCQQDPDELLAGVLGPIGPLREVRAEGLDLLGIGRARENVANSQFDLLPVSGCLFETSDQPIRPVGKQLAGNAFAVADQEGF